MRKFILAFVFLQSTLGAGVTAEFNRGTFEFVTFSFDEAESPVPGFIEDFLLNFQGHIKEKTGVTLTNVSHHGLHQYRLDNTKDKKDSFEIENLFTRFESDLKNKNYRMACELKNILQRKTQIESNK